MLSDSDFEEIRAHLTRSQNPVFLYDNDADGLCSFVLFRRFCERGKGVVIRSHPDIDVKYAKKVKELGADAVFVLDRPFLGESFLREIAELHIPVIWIDHHDVKNAEKYDSLFCYNPVFGKESSAEPVTYLAYKTTKREEDDWLALMGCISDHYLPDFSASFAKKYPNYWAKVSKPFEAYYKTEIGLVARALSFGLKDSLTNVLYLQNLLIGAKSPADIIAEMESHSSFGKKYQEIRKKYDSLIEKARLCVGNKLLFFTYSGDLSISSDLANQLSFEFPSLIIVVAFMSGPVSNLSMRGKNVRDIFMKTISGFEGATGGGHEEAIGGRLRTEDLDDFKKALEEAL